MSERTAPPSQLVQEKFTVQIESIVGSDPRHRHDLLTEFIPVAARSILDVGGATEVGSPGNWRVDLGGRRASWRAVPVGVSAAPHQRTLVSTNVVYDYNHLRRPNVVYDGTRMPYGDDAFDVATSVDVFEHMPSHNRPLVLHEMIRVSRMRALLVFPFNSPENVAMEEALLRMQEENGIKPKPSVLEHRHHGLPDVETILGYLREIRVPFQYSFESDRTTFMRFNQLSVWVNMMLRNGYTKADLKPYLDRLEDTVSDELDKKTRIRREDAYRLRLVIDTSRGRLPLKGQINAELPSVEQWAT